MKLTGWVTYRKHLHETYFFLMCININNNSSSTYYQKNKKACERYQNLSEEEKEKCGCQRYEDVPWHEKQMLLKKVLWNS